MDNSLGQNEKSNQDNSNKLLDEVNGEFGESERFYQEYFHRDWKIVKDVDLEQTAIRSNALIQLQISHNETINTLSLTLCRLLIEMSTNDKQIRHQKGQAMNGESSTNFNTEYPFLVLRLLPTHSRYHIKVVECLNDITSSNNNPYNFIDHEECEYYDIFQTFVFPNLPKESLKHYTLDCSVWLTRCYFVLKETSLDDIETLEVDSVKKGNSAQGRKNKNGAGEDCRHYVTAFLGMGKIAFENVQRLDNTRFWVKTYIPKF